MRKLFYKLTPAILAGLGFFFGMGGYLIDRYVPAKYDLLLWSLVILIQVAIAFICGRLIQKLHYGMRRDALTGLRNRYYFYEKLAEELHRANRTNAPLALAMVDIDNFKTVNDVYGHLAGDKILQELANIFNSKARAIDSVVRWGGEEFAAILPETDHQGAWIFAERIRKNVQDHNFRVNPYAQTSITVSIGIAMLRAGDTDLEKLVSMADTALYKAKEKKNTIEIINCDFPPRHLQLIKS